MDSSAREQILIVPYCHSDWAWTHTRKWHAERYAQAIAEVLDILSAQDEAGIPDDAPHAVRWYLDVYVPQFVPFLDLYPERLTELRRWVARGRVAVCGGYANPRVNHVEGETFVRSLVFGRRAFGRLFPDADLGVHADLVDVAWAHPQAPQLLRQAGYRFLRGWRPHDALNAKGVPYHFVWTGLDGTEILCSRGPYGGVVDPALIPSDYADRWSNIVALWETHAQTSLADKRERSPLPLLWVQHGADDNRPLRAIFGTDTRLDLEGFIQEWNRRESSRMRFATPLEVFGELAKLSDQLPVRCGTLDPCDVGYNAAWNGANGLWRLRRDAARTLLRAEALASLAAPAGLAYPTETLDRLWRQTLLFSCHATQWLFHDDFDEIMELARATIFDGRRLVDDAARHLVEQIALPQDALAVVVNSLPFERAVTVPLRVMFVEGERGGVPPGLRLIDARGRDVPYQITNELRHRGIRWEIETLARIELPPGGWNLVRWLAGDEAMAEPRSAPPPRAPELAIDNEHLRLEFRQGRLQRIVDLASGQVDEAPIDTPFGHLRAYTMDTDAPLHVGPIVGRHDAEWFDWDVVEGGPVRTVVRARGQVARHPVELEIRLPVGERRVEVAATIDWQGMDGYLAFHLPLPFAGELWGGIPYGVERKELADEPYVGIERLRAGAFWAHGFVDWSGPERGIAYVPHDGDTYYVWDADQRAIQHILINSLRRPRDNWEKDVNAGVEAVGRHQFTASLVWHEGDWRAARLWRSAASLAESAVVVNRRRGRGDRPGWHSLIAVEPDNVVLSALYREGDATLVRLYETAGRETDALVRLSHDPAQVAVVDLLGQPLVGEAGPPVVLDGQTVRIHLRPWQIATLAVRALERPSARPSG